MSLVYNISSKNLLIMVKLWIGTISCVWENLKKFIGHSHVCGTLEYFAPMWVFCQYGSCSYLDSWGAGGGSIVPQSDSFSSKCCRFKQSTSLVRRLQSSISKARVCCHAESWTGRKGWTGTPEVATQDPDSHQEGPMSGFLWPSPAGGFV